MRWKWPLNFTQLSFWRSRESKPCEYDFSFVQHAIIPQLSGRYVLVRKKKLKWNFFPFPPSLFHSASKTYYFFRAGVTWDRERKKLLYRLILSISCQVRPQSSENCDPHRTNIFAYTALIDSEYTRWYVYLPDVGSWCTDYHGSAMKTARFLSDAIQRWISLQACMQVRIYMSWCDASTCVKKAIPEVTLRGWMRRRSARQGIGRIQVAVDVSISSTPYQIIPR